MKNNLPSSAPAHVPTDYTARLRKGIERLKAQIKEFYRDNFPHDWIERAVAEAEKSAWQTPFPSLFFVPLAHARITQPQFQFAPRRRVSKNK